MLSMCAATQPESTTAQYLLVCKSGSETSVSSSELDVCSTSVELQLTNNSAASERTTNVQSALVVPRLKRIPLPKTLRTTELTFTLGGNNVVNNSEANNNNGSNANANNNDNTNSKANNNTSNANSNNANNNNNSKANNNNSNNNANNRSAPKPYAAMLSGMSSMSRYSYSFNLDLNHTGTESTRSESTNAVGLKTQLIEELKSNSLAFAPWKSAELQKRRQRQQDNQLQKYLDEANEHLSYWQRRSQPSITTDTSSERHELSSSAADLSSSPEPWSPEPLRRQAQLLATPPATPEADDDDSGGSTTDSGNDDESPRSSEVNLQETVIVVKQRALLHDIIEESSEEERVEQNNQKDASEESSEDEVVETRSNKENVNSIDDFRQADHAETMTIDHDMVDSGCKDNLHNESNTDVHHDENITTNSNTPTDASNQKTAAVPLQAAAEENAAQLPAPASEKKSTIQDTPPPVNNSETPTMPRKASPNAWKCSSLNRKAEKADRLQRSEAAKQPPLPRQQQRPVLEAPGTQAAEAFDVWSWKPIQQFILLDRKLRRRPPRIKRSNKVKPVISMRKPLKNISLSLDKVPCFAGQVLRGTLNFSLRDATHIKSITLVFEGSSKTSAGNGDSGTKQQWWKNRGSLQDFQFFHVEVPCLTYLQRVNSVLNGDNKYRLDAGNHEIPFAFPVPPRVPSSFGGKYGYVYYCVKANVITAATLGTAEFRTEKAIPLIGIENLNWHTHMRNTIALTKTVTKHGFCGSKINAHVLLQLKKTGYLPGETISLNAEIENRHRSRRIKRVNFELLQTVYFQVSHDRERVVRNVLAQVAKLDVLPGCIEVLEDEPVHIPGCPPSFLRGADAINIQYDLIVSVEGRVAVRCPLVIGTVPFLGKHMEPQPIDWKAGEASVPYVRMSMAWPWHKPAGHTNASYFSCRAQPAFAYDQQQHQQYYEDEKPTLKIEEIID